MITERMTKYLAGGNLRIIEVARWRDGIQYIARIGYRDLSDASNFVCHAAGRGDTPTEALAALDLNMRRE